MYMHSCWRADFTADDGLEAIAPLAAIPRTSAGIEALVDCWRPAGGAALGVGLAVLISLAGVYAEPLILALGGAAAFVYLATALISGRAGPAALDLTAATAAAWLALAATGPAVSALLVHVVWGVLRGAWPGVAPGRSFAMSWAAMHAVAALLLGLGS
jgi:hypothetical protein